MGGRGASSGVSGKGNVYGTQFRTIFESGNFKFVAKVSRRSEPLMETMTPGRVYVETGGHDLLRIVFFDGDNKRNKVIERDKRTGRWHVHYGYYHTEGGGEKHGPLSAEEKRYLDSVVLLWNNYQQRT